MTAVVRQATLISFDPATWTAMVQVDGGDSNVVMDVGRWLAPGSLAENDQVGVMLYEETNPAWGMVVGPHGGAPRLDWPGLASLHLGLPGLRGFWPLGSVGDGGNAGDLSGQARTLTYNGNPIYGLHDDLVPYLAFDGTDDHLLRADEAGLDILGSEAYMAAPGLTVGAWVYPTASGANQLILGKRNDTGNQRAWSLFRLSAGNFLSAGIFSLGTAASEVAVTSSNAVAQDVWSFIAMRYRPSAELAVWVNGVKTINTSGIHAALFNSSAGFRISGRDTTTNLYTGRAALAWLCVGALPDALIDRLWRVSRLAFGV